MLVQKIEGVFSDSGTSNPYLNAVEEQIDALHCLIKSNYTMAAGAVGECVTPVFEAAVNGVKYFTDVLAGRGKGGQAPFPQAGMRYGGENGRHFLNRQMAV